MNTGEHPRTADADNPSSDHRPNDGRQNLDPIEARQARISGVAWKVLAASLALLLVGYLAIAFLF